MRSRILCFAAVATLLCACGRDGGGLPLPRNGDSVVGDVLTLRLERDTGILDLAQRYGVGLEDLARANPHLPSLRNGRVPAGTPLTVPMRFVLPDAPREGIVVNIAEMRLYYFPDHTRRKPRRVMAFPAAVGREEWETPTGRTHVAERIEEPEWYPPDSIRQEHAARGEPLPEVVPAGAQNPLGRYALRLGWKKHLIHGTNNPRSVGKPVTHGCIRLYPDHIETLFERVREGTPVTLVDQPYKLGTREGDLFLESHPDSPAAADAREAVLKQIELWVRKKDGRRVDPALVRRLLAKSGGVPVKISR